MSRQLEVRLLKGAWRGGLAVLAAGILLAGCQRQQFIEATAGQTAASDSTMVVSASPYATRVGASILRSGGNAVDAAVGVAFALTVTYPTAGNIGGGGLMLARMNGETVALDFRERAPLAASRDMYLDATGNPTDRSVTGTLAAGVPGSVAGLYAAHRRFGALPWRDVVQPAIELAKGGFLTDSAFVEDIDDNMARVSPAFTALYAPQGVPVAVGTRFGNPDLARTLQLIADRGAQGFYEGETAEKLVAEMQRGGGIISLEDLKQYEPKWRTPVAFAYRGHQVLTMPPVSSGGLTFALIANILGGYDLRAMGAHSADAIHMMAEAERAAFARRNTLLADPDFVTIPSTSFLSPDTAAALRGRISMTQRSADLVPADPVRGQHTTHFSVVDGKGNAVALTTTLNTGFGSAVTVTGAGFLLNNEMDDFTVKPGALNQMGLRQGEANAIVPGKRMLSRMTPTIVLDSAQDYPDRLDLTVPGIADSVEKALEARGHTIRARKGGMGFGWAQAIMRTGGRWHGVSEPAGHGLAAGY
ncbi:MAG: gamma-glutamyltransferase [Gemmatimonadaceae bacterium]